MPLRRFVKQFTSSRRRSDDLGNLRGLRRRVRGQEGWNVTHAPQQDDDRRGGGGLSSVSVYRKRARLGDGLLRPRPDRLRSSANRGRASPGARMDESFSTWRTLQQSVGILTIGQPMSSSTSGSSQSLAPPALTTRWWRLSAISARAPYQRLRVSRPICFGRVRLGRSTSGSGARERAGYPAFARPATNQITKMTAPTATKTWMGRVTSPPQKVSPTGVGKGAGG